MHDIATHSAVKRLNAEGFNVCLSVRSKPGKPVVFEADVHSPLTRERAQMFSKLDVAGLRQIAEASRGQYAPVQDLHVLVDAISNMWLTELSTEERQRHKPRYQWFVALALVFLGMETLIGERRPVAEELQRVWQQEGSS